MSKAFKELIQVGTSLIYEIGIYKRVWKYCNLKSKNLWHSNSDSKAIGCVNSHMCPAVQVIHCGMFHMRVSWCICKYVRFIGEHIHTFPTMQFSDTQSLFSEAYEGCWLVLPFLILFQTFFPFFYLQLDRFKFVTFLSIWVKVRISKKLWI